MDFNDIRLRLDRIHKSVGSMLDTDIEKYSNIRTVRTKDFIQFSARFNKGDVADLANKVMMVIHNLATLKDHLKAKLKLAGGNPSTIENEIKNSKHLQIVIDLDNADKHTYPTQSNRSGLNPKISDVRTVMSLGVSVPGDVSVVTFDLSGTFNREGNVGIKIIGDILDQQDNQIMTLDELVDSSVVRWEEIISRHNLK